MVSISASSVRRVESCFMGAFAGASISFPRLAEAVVIQTVRHTSNHANLAIPAALCTASDSITRVMLGREMDVFAFASNALIDLLSSQLAGSVECSLMLLRPSVGTGDFPVIFR